MRLPMLISTRTHTDTHTQAKPTQTYMETHNGCTENPTANKPKTRVKVTFPNSALRCLHSNTPTNRETERMSHTHSHTHLSKAFKGLFIHMHPLYIFLQEHLSPCNISGCCRGYKLSTEVHFQCSYLVRSKWWIILSWFNTSGTLILAYIFTPCCLPHSHHLAQWRESCIGPEHCLPAIPARTQTAKLLSEFVSLSESRHHFLFSKNHFFPLPMKTCLRFSAFFR